jgi:hypothetical protein
MRVALRPDLNLSPANQPDKQQQQQQNHGIQQQQQAVQQSHQQHPNGLEQTQQQQQQRTALQDPQPAMADVGKYQRHPYQLQMLC